MDATTASELEAKDMPLSFGRKVERYVCEICNIPLTSEEQMRGHLAGKNHAKKVRSLEKLKELESGSQVAHKDREESGDATAGRLDAVDNYAVVPVEKLAKKRKTIVQIPCHTCGMIFNKREVADEHLRSEKHLKKVAQVEELKMGIVSRDIKVLQTPDDVPLVKLMPPPPADPPELEECFYCQFCDKQLNSPEQCREHRAGAAHQRKVNKAKEIKNDIGKIRVNFNKGKYPCEICNEHFQNSAELHRHTFTPYHRRTAAHIQGRLPPQYESNNSNWQYQPEPSNQPSPFGGFEYEHGPPSRRKPPNFFSEYDGYGHYGHS